MESITTPPAVDMVWPKIHAAIHRAKFSNDTSELRESLKGDANIGDLADVHTATGMTVLHTSSDSNVEIIDLLIARGAVDVLEVKCRPGEEGRYAGCTALQMAAKSGCEEVARRLIHHGANYDAFSAVALGDEAQLRDVYAADKSVLHAMDDYESSLVHWAADAGYLEIVELLFDTGADVTKPNLFAETPLLVASTGYPENQPLVKFLWRESEKQFSSLVLSALGYDKPLGLLLEKHPRGVTTTSTHGLTPLHWAARNGRESTAEILLSHDADVNAQDKTGCTPLWHAACRASNETIVQLLCDNGADVQAENMWGKTVLDYDCGEACAKIIRSRSN